MKNNNPISSAVLDVMPGWSFVSTPQGFGWAPDRHFRAVLQKGGENIQVIIRHSWNLSGFEIEKYLYESVLYHFTFETPELLGTFVTNEDDTPWMILQDIGDRVAMKTRLEDRNAFLQSLGWLHGSGRRLLESGQLHESPLQYFPTSHAYTHYDEWESLLVGGLGSDKYDLPDSSLEICRRLRDTLAAEPQTLLHGDTDYSNAIVSDRGVSLLDWERSCIGPASVDLGRVVCGHDFEDEILSYRAAFSESAGFEMSRQKAFLVARFGIIFESLRWICYYIKKVAAGQDPGEEWYHKNYQPCLEHVTSPELINALTLNLNPG